MCCLFGFLDYKGSLSAAQKNKMLRVLSRECEERGTDATGIAFNENGELKIYKKPLPAHRAHLYMPDHVNAVMGHTRLTTQGSEKKNYNNHPFRGHVPGTSFALAHNGVLHNDLTLRTTEHLPEAKIQTDSYVAVQLIEKKQSLGFDSLRYMAQSVVGSFCFTVLDDRDTLYFVKGDNPMTIYDFRSIGLIVYASTPRILNRALKKLRMNKLPYREIPIACGDLLRITSDGHTEREKFEFDDWFGFPLAQTGKPYENSLTQTDYGPAVSAYARLYGMEEEEFEYWLRSGFTPDEIEEFLYL